MEINTNSSQSPDNSSNNSEKKIEKKSTRNTIKQEIINWTILIFVIVILRSSVFGHYLIPTGSMLPTIKLNDHVVANKLAYGLMLPLGETQVISWAKPERGDIVLFKSKEDITLIKRVTGLEGDKVSFKSGVLNINNNPVSEEEVDDRSIMNDMGESSEGKTLYLESNLGSKSADAHYVLRNRYNSFTASDTREFIVPAGHVLCLGDNRDNSKDGRFWGMLETSKIYGKAMFISYSTNPAVDGILPAFRTDRFFRSLK